MQSAEQLHIAKDKEGEDLLSAYRNLGDEAHRLKLSISQAEQENNSLRIKLGQTEQAAYHRDAQVRKLVCNVYKCCYHNQLMRWTT